MGCVPDRVDIHQDMDKGEEENSNLPVYLKGKYSAIKKIPRKKVGSENASNSERELFHGHIVQTEWTDLSESELLRVFRFITTRDNYHDGTFGCFEPGIALMIETDRGKFDALVCLECYTIHFISQSGRRSSSLSELGLDRWKAFYLDNYILKKPKVIEQDIAPK